MIPNQSDFGRRLEKYLDRVGRETCFKESEIVSAEVLLTQDSGLASLIRLTNNPGSDNLKG
jgi:hypothetical protein